MFDALKKLFGSDTPAVSARAGFDVAGLKMLFDYFPIGKKLRYFPEYRRDALMHSIVIAYRVNDHYLYSRDAILFNASWQPTGFRINERTVLAVNELTRFQILLPDTSDQEKTLDYFTRAEIGRAGQFNRGNTISLIADPAERGIPVVDTQVDRCQTLTDGPYADSPTVLVTPDFASLTMEDKRRRQRVDADLLAYLYVNSAERPFPCVLADFSEASLRLDLREASLPMPALAVDEKVLVEFNFGGMADEYRIQGRVFRREDAYCVILLEQIHKDGEYGKIKMMDVIEIKTGLLNRSE